MGSLLINSNTYTILSHWVYDNKLSDSTAMELSVNDFAVKCGKLWQ